MPYSAVFLKGALTLAVIIASKGLINHSLAEARPDRPKTKKAPQLLLEGPRLKARPGRGGGGRSCAPSPELTP